MCLYSRIIENPKYKPNMKNGGQVPPVFDKRVLKVAIGCGDCMECRKAVARNWQIRLSEEIKSNPNGKMVTLTFSDKSIKELCEQERLKGLKGYELDNMIATRAMRLFNERWRKRYGRALRHWTVTELGHVGTENIHLHGIVWTDRTFDEIREKWGYGYIWPRPERSYRKYYVSERSVNYMIKYVHKVDADHKMYKSRILTSPGIGKDYINRLGAMLNKYKGEDTNDTYRTRTGHRIALPVYYRNKIYSDDEREKLWIQKLDEGKRYVGGEEVHNNKEWYELTKWYRRLNKELGYGKGDKDWDLAEYEKEQRWLKQQTRIMRELEREAIANGYPKEWD